jgi:hypothetical protein
MSRLVKLTLLLPAPRARWVQFSAHNAGQPVNRFLCDLVSRVLEDGDAMRGDWPGQAPLFLREVKERNAREAEKASETIRGIIEGVCPDESVGEWISAKERNAEPAQPGTGEHELPAVSEPAQ